MFTERTANPEMQDLDRLAGRYRAVAFDVFDTLIHRDAAAPTDVFAWMEADGTAPEGFAARRVAAEAAARAACAPREVTLAELYSRHELEGLDPEAEIRAETALAVPDRKVQALYRACRARGQKVYVISDMYLPAQAIAAMLEACGYEEPDGLFVSSEYGVQKRSGKLFRLFLEKTGLSPRDVLFLGDDRRADCMGAALAGIRGVKLPGRLPRPDYFPEPTDRAEGALAAFCANHGQMLDDPEEAFGYTVMGPLVLAFARWLRAHRDARPRGRLVFLARDMYLVREVCRLLGEQESSYLCVSRRSLCPALLMRPMTPEAQTLLLDTLPRQVMRVDDILTFCGFAPGTELPGYDGRRMFDLRRRPADAELTQLLLKIAALSRGTAGMPVRESAANVRTYLRDFDLSRPGTLLVDIGSGGTTQRVLQELCGVPLHGLYLACDSRLFERLPHSQAEVCLFAGQPAPLWFWMAQPLLEYLISEPCGPTLGYHEAGTSVSPMREPVAPPAELLAVQRGVLRFAKEWSASSLNGLELSPDRTVLPFLRMARRPALRQAVCFGDFTLEDGVSFRLAAPAPLTAYLRNPARLARDFKDSRWKIGFLRRLLRLPLPYDAVYSLLKGGSAPGKDA